MNYYNSHATVMRYWRINLIPINDKGWGTAHSPVFRGKTVEGAIKAAERHCRKFKMQEKPGAELFQVYGVDKENPVKYECNAWGREKH